VMNANKALLTGLLLAGVLAPLSPAHAAEEAMAVRAAPALYGVKEIQVQQSRLANPQASANCGTSSGELSAMLLKAFKADGLPAFSILGATPVKQGTARIDIFPDVATLQPRDKECVSWVSFTAQSKDVLRVYPVETPRNLITTYWSGGLMIGTSAAAHPAALNEAVTKLEAAFSRQYRLDQPPALTPPDAANVPAPASK